MSKAACLFRRDRIDEPAADIYGAKRSFGMPGLRNLIRALRFKTEQQLMRQFGALLHRQMQSIVFDGFSVHEEVPLQQQRYDILRDRA
jgi:hypothetical protein